MAKQIQVITQDLEILQRADLLGMSINRAGNREYWVMPKGYRYYEYIKTRDAEPIAQVEREIRGLIESGGFAERYAETNEKWLAAAQALWHADSQKEATAIGHHCREAMRSFATALVDQHQPVDAPGDPSKDVARIRAVLNSVKGGLGRTELQLLDALLGYWGAVTDIAQRQEHGAEREGEPLTWDDSRRLVFQAAVLFYELDRSLRRLGPR